MVSQFLHRKTHLRLNNFPNVLLIPFKPTITYCDIEHVDVWLDQIVKDKDSALRGWNNNNSADAKYEYRHDHSDRYFNNHTIPRHSGQILKTSFWGVRSCCAELREKVWLVTTDQSVEGKTLVLREAIMQNVILKVIGNHYIIYQQQ